MANTIWPLFDLRVTTPRLELRYIDDALAFELADLAAQGIHDPAVMPFGIAWTDAEPEQLRHNVVQYYWRTRGDLTAAAWDLNLAAIVNDEVVGVAGIHTADFAIRRLFTTGSWLGRAHQGKGYGKELRQAALHLGFAGFGAVAAKTGAFSDNPASLGVTRSLGYQPDGIDIRVRRGLAASIEHFRLDRADWEARLRRDDITITGLEPCLPLLGLA